MSTVNTGSLLIVDDEPFVRRALERLLRKEGYDIHSAGDAAAADAILKQTPIDVILCDQDMPGKSGIEFLQESAEKYPQQRRLMISGRFQSGEVAQAMDTGAVHQFMMKPWDDAILKADIRSSFRHIVKEHSEDKGVMPSWTDFAEDRKLTRELHSAASDGSLSLVYQPQISLDDQSVCGAEALLRWTASSGPIGADKFIFLAERGGSMSQLSHWVFHEVCHNTQKWLTQWSDVKISFNISPVDLNDDGLIDHMEAMLEHYSLSAEVLQVEVTESHALICSDQMLARLNRMADMGLTLAIDDFGAGATTLSYLAELPFSTLKLDRSLTRQLAHYKGKSVVQKVLEMARCLGMTTTVEGIETEQEALLAKELGANIAQGYFFSKPRPRSAIESWIDSGRRAVP